MRNRDLELAFYIQEHPEVSPHDLARLMDVSERTIRTRVSRANEALKSAAHIELRRGGGYRLAVLNQQELDLLREREDIPYYAAPTDAEERCSYILNDLLWRADWVTLDQLADMMYVSRSTINRDIRHVEERLASYSLDIERKPYRGIRVVGSESSKRLLLAALAVDATIDGASNTTVEAIKGVIDDVLAEDGIQISSVAYQNMLVHITVALLRIEQGNFAAMDPAQLNQLSSTREYASARKISHRIEEVLGTKFPEAEIAYITVHLAAKQTLSSIDNHGVIISDEVWDIVGRMLETVWDEYRFDFRGDLELKMNLARHIIPLGVRLTHHLTLHNPLLSETKRRFPLAYAMARHASSVLFDAYHAHPSEEELGYLALAFALALERRQTAAPKKNILIVCASGMGSARLLEHRYRSEFGAYLNRVETCDVAAVAQKDLSDVDYVFTTVPIAQSLPVPVRAVNFFLEPEDIEELRTLLSQTNDSTRMLSCFDRSLFYPHLHATDKWSVLDMLCTRMVEAHAADADFAKCVEERERMFPTSLGDLVAVPHAATPTGKRTAICVGILDKPVPWDDYGHAVQVVLVVSYANEEQSSVRDLFSAISTNLLSEDVLHRLVADQTWESFIASFRE